jgi:hypothetical protein
VPRLRRTLPVALATVAATLLGACGGDDPAAGPSSGAGAGAAAGAEKGGEVKVCEVVPAETAERLVGDSSGEVQELDAAGDLNCWYDGKERGTLNVVVLPADTYGSYAEATDTTPVSGIGDKAAETDGKLVYQLLAVQGEHLVQFSVGAPVSDAGKIGVIDKAAVREAMAEALKSL